MELRVIFSANITNELRGPPPQFSLSASITTSTLTTAEVKVVTSIPAKTQIFYGLTVAYGLTTVQSLSQTTSYFNLADLATNKTYHMKAVSLADGETESSPDLTFILGNATPTTPSSSSPLPSQSSYPPFTQNLSLGSTGSEVTELQTLLDAWGYLKTTPTGYYGTLTDVAVKAFQSANGIAPVGSVGPITRAKLNELIGADTGTVARTTAASANIAPTSQAAATGVLISSDLTPGSSGPQVTELQTLLTKDGDYSGPITGYYGTLTEKGVEAFQTKYGIVTSGTPETTGYGAVGPKTRGRLEEE